MIASRFLRVFLASVICAAPAVAQMLPIPSAPQPLVPLPSVAASIPPTLGIGATAAVPGVSAAMPVPIAPVLPLAGFAGTPIAPVGHAGAAAPAAALRAMSVPLAAAAAFDGARGEADMEDVSEEMPAKAMPDILELYIPRQSVSGVKKSQLTAHAGLIRGESSEWYWGKFRKGGLIAVRSASQTMFASKIVAAKTIKISSMQRKDFAGLFSPQRMARKTITQLRKALVQDLEERESRRRLPTPVSTNSKIRLVSFLSAQQSRDLPQNKEDAANYPALAREPVALPEGLQSIHRYLPKTVLIDMRLFRDGVPYPLLEDMTKLMKDGVYFVLLSDKPNSGPGSVEDLLTKRLSLKQRDAVSRYKMMILSDDGNHLTGYRGNFAKSLPSERFEDEELDMMAFVAQSEFPGAKVESNSTHFDVTLPRGVEAEAARTAFFEGLVRMSVKPERWQWKAGKKGARTVISARPQTLISALPHLLENMRDQEDVYVNNSDLMVISRDTALLGALPGSVQPAVHLDSDGERFADESLAALLGPYRENKPGDFAASASKISSFNKKRTSDGSGEFGNIYMMMGHVIHAAFNWAFWVYRNTGAFPTVEETVQAARKKWERELQDSQRSLTARSGESLGGYYETTELRLREMYENVKALLDEYPIAVGTELPLLIVVDRIRKGGVYSGRDMFRLIFDLVLARKTADGKLEIAVVDFKTGQTSTLQKLEKDTQVQLYDMYVRQVWKKLPLPYGGTGLGHDVVDHKLIFVYKADAREPVLNDWTRLKFRRWLMNIMDRMRKQNSPSPKAATGKKGVKIDKTRPKTGDPAKLDLPQVVLGLKIKKAEAEQILAGEKTVLARHFPISPKSFLAIVSTSSGEKLKRPAEVVAYARIAKITPAEAGGYQWHLTNITPVGAYVAPNNKPGSRWIKDIPVQGPRRLRREKK